MRPALSALRAGLPRGHTLPPAQFESRHRVLTRLLWLHVLALPVVAALYGYPWYHCLLEGGVIALWAVAAQTRPGGRRLQAMVTAGGLMTCSAVLVHITNGLIEAHFHFFVLVTVLSLYEDWVVYLVAVGYVLAHHLLGALLGMDIYAHGGSPWLWAGVHSGYIGALCVANVVIWRSTEGARLDLRVAHEQLERQAAELARSNRELRDFTAVASHDLSEPLRMVTGYLRLLERRGGDRLEPEDRQLVGYAMTGAERLRTLIDDLLVYSRVERAPLQAVTVDLRTVLATTLADLGEAVREAGADVRIGPLPLVSGDAGQLGQLLQNLVGNAIKFRSAAPPVVEVSGEVRGDRVHLTVADNGIGVRPQDADRIFEMFQRLHTRDAYPGTGIGLAVCRAIAERHGGTLSVAPNPGGGSRFTCTLPAPRTAPTLALSGDVGEGPLPDVPRDPAGA